MDVEWLDDDERSTWVRLAAVMALLPATLDAQLRRDAGLTHFEYFVLAMLSEAPRRTMRMTRLALHTSATLPRLSHVVRRMEERGLVQRLPSPDDARATDVTLTEGGWQKLEATAPGHVATVRRHVMDVLSPAQVGQLGDIAEAVLRTLDPDDRIFDTFDRRPGEAGDDAG